MTNSSTGSASLELPVIDLAKVVVAGLVKEALGAARAAEARATRTTDRANIFEDEGFLYLCKKCNENPEGSP
jgi:hypothetical protein